MKVAINTCYGGFGLSDIAQIMLLKKKVKEELYFYKAIIDSNLYVKRYERITEKQYVEIDDFNKIIVTKFCIDSFSTTDEKLCDDFYKNIQSQHDYIDTRNDEDLINVIESIGCELSSCRHSDLEIVEIPDDVNFEISNYDGIETIHEVHRSWS